MEYVFLFHVTKKARLFRKTSLILTLNLTTLFGKKNWQRLSSAWLCLDLKNCQSMHIYFEIVLLAN